MTIKKWKCHVKDVDTLQNKTYTCLVFDFVSPECKLYENIVNQKQNKTKRKKPAE